MNYEVSGVYGLVLRDISPMQINEISFTYTAY